MIHFFIKTVVNSAGRVAVYGIKQSLKSRQSKYSSNQDPANDEKLQKNAYEIKTKADNYKEWLEKGVTLDFVEEIGKLSLTNYQPTFDYPDLIYPDYLNKFPTPPDESKIVKIHSFRLLLGKMINWVSKLNEKTLAEKKVEFLQLRMTYDYELEHIQSKRERFKANWEYEKDMYKVNYRETIEMVDQLKIAIKGQKPYDYAPFVKTILKEFILPYGDKIEFTDVNFDLQNRNISVMLRLPAPTELPIIKSARFLVTYGRLKTTEFTDVEQKRNYFKYLEQVVFHLSYFLLATDDLEGVNELSIRFHGTDSFQTLLETAIERPIELVDFINEPPSMVKLKFKKFKVSKKEIGSLLFS
jgi:hypothetical protein